MNEAKKYPSSAAALQAMRSKLESIVDNTIPAICALNDRLDKALDIARKSSAPPPPDPRREPNDDPRVDDAIPVDVVPDTIREIPKARFSGPIHIPRPTPKVKT